MNSPGSGNYNLILRDIDAIAIQLKRLQSAGVPVLWRPLHEAGGTWFWWGAKGPDACKKLWALMYDRMTNYHKLNNLIWIWNWEDPSWYPGNNAVDIVSTDIYASAGNHDPQVAAFNRLKSLSGDMKIIAMAENGVIPNWSSSAPWSFWMTWNGNFITDGVSNSRSFLQNIFTSPNVLTLDEISGWKSGGGGGPSPTTTKQATTPRPTTTARPANGGAALVSSPSLSTFWSLLTCISMVNVVVKAGLVQLLVLQEHASFQTNVSQSKPTHWSHTGSINNGYRVLPVSLRDTPTVCI